MNGKYIWNHERPPLSTKMGGMAGGMADIADGIYVHEQMNGWCVLSADFMMH